MSRPWVAAKVAELRAQLDREAVMDMVRRRKMLADIAVEGWRKRKGNAKPADAIAAIREDAILAGERRTDGTQVNIAGDVSFTVVLQALRAQAQSVIDVPAQPETERQPEMPALASPGDSGEVSGAGRAPQPPSSSGGPVCGPLGRIVGTGPTAEPSGREPRAVSPAAVPLGFDE